jgi:hypothetical protein
MTSEQCYQPVQGLRNYTIFIVQLLLHAKGAPKSTRKHNASPRTVCVERSLTWPARLYICAHKRRNNAGRRQHTLMLPTEFDPATSSIRASQHHERPMYAYCRPSLKSGRCIKWCHWTVALAHTNIVHSPNNFPPINNTGLQRSLFHLKRRIKRGSKHNLFERNTAGTASRMSFFPHAVEP